MDEYYAEYDSLTAFYGMDLAEYGSYTTTTPRSGKTIRLVKSNIDGTNLRARRPKRSSAWPARNLHSAVTDSRPRKCDGK